MKLYDQNIMPDGDDGSNNYCVPTAGSMALSALTFGGVSYYSWSWTNKNFVGESAYDRIDALADYLDTDKNIGTYSSDTKKFRNRQKDFSKAKKMLYTPEDEIKLNDARMREYIRDQKVFILIYGHYTETCGSIGGETICSYSRNGGHAVTVNGYYYNSGSGSYTTHIFNPEGGYESERDITYLSKKSTYTLPGGINWDGRTFGSYSYYLKTSGSTGYKIIEFVTGIDTN